MLNILFIIKIKKKNVFSMRRDYNEERLQAPVPLSNHPSLRPNIVKLEN